jgi:four helix bundle protein
MGGDFVELRAWREAASLAADVIRLASDLRGPGARALADQLVRSAESVPANIAEGYGRGLGNDGVRFFVIARGSAAELESHLRVAATAGRIPEPAAGTLVERIRFVRLLTHRLLLSVAARAGKQGR